jgi:RIO kinase 1
MTKLKITDFIDDDYEEYIDSRSRRKRVGPRPWNLPKRTHNEIIAELVEQSDGLETKQFSYNASRHEREWIQNSLGGFIEQMWIDDIQRILKGGKEASVYQCTGDNQITGKFIAAKVYRPRKFRNLKNDYLYREGRDRLDAEGKTIIDGGMLNAMRKRTNYGRQLLHTSWVEHEYQTMRLLHSAGVDLPTPYARGDNAILMKYIGGPDIPAPTLNTVTLDKSEAHILFQRVVNNIELMLANYRIHGDLSAYNILYWDGEIHIIDFPQAINPEQNINAFRIFERDFIRIGDYFSRQGLRIDPKPMAAELWTSYNFPLIPELPIHLLEEHDEEGMNDSFVKRDISGD